MSQAQQTGTLYGLAWRSSAKTLYAGVYFKHFTGFGQNGVGDKSGAIYSVAMDPVTGDNTAAPVLFADVNTFGVDVSCPTRTRVAGPNNDEFDLPPAYSDTTIANIGKCSLGDLELSDDEATLFAMDLKNRQVLRINAVTGAYIGAWPAPTSGLPTAAGVCATGDVRPFGLGYRDGELYVGAVCSAESTVSGTGNGTPAGLQAYVWKVNGSGAYTLILNYQIIADRYDPMGSTATPPWGNWNPWKFTYAQLAANRNPSFATDFVGHPQPMLSDIEFYGNDLILGFRDRLGDQWGSKFLSRPAPGTLSPTTPAATSSAFRGTVAPTCWKPTGSCGGRTASQTGVGDNPTNEFYWGDGSTNTSLTGNDATEYSQGGIAQWGVEPLATVTVDPAVAWNVAYFDAQGVNRLGNQNGEPTKGYVMYDSATSLGTWGKANGLGDLEALSDPAPIELGNRVWNDANGNGIQDPGEDPIGGVTVQLVKNNVVVGTAVTDANGTYYFLGGAAADPNPNDNQGIVIGGIQPNQSDYEIRIAAGQTALSQLVLAPANAPQPANGNASATNNNPITDIADSDATISGANAVIAYTTGGPGANNHGLDFGFRAADWGDLPDSYNTTAGNNGANHVIDATNPAPWLGVCVDSEASGVPSIPANGDNLADSPLDFGGACTDDEDGVAPWDDWTNGTGDIYVTVGGATACLNAWMDFANDSGAVVAGGDANFGDSVGALSEWIIRNKVMPVGVGQAVSFPLPSGLPAGNYYLRYRLTPNLGNTATCADDVNAYTGGAPTWSGAAKGGEVEDYRVNTEPLAVVLVDFNAVAQANDVLVTWETASELDNRGFNLWRGTSPAEPDTRLNQTLIASQSQGSPAGFIYTWIDSDNLVPGTTYHYWLDAVAVGGATTRYGPVSATFQAPTAVTVSSLTASSATTGSLGWPAAAMLLAAGLTAGLSWRRRSVR